MGIFLFKNKSVYKLAAVYIGTIIGAGFATGREIVSYFTVYGEIWLFGMILAGILFSIGCWACLDITYRNKIRGCNEFLNHIFGSKLGAVLDVFTNIFVMVLFLAMTSASGHVIHEILGIGDFKSTVLFVLTCAIVFIIGIDGIVWVNSVLSPVIIFGGVIIGAVLILFENKAVANIAYPMILSVFTYVSYNSITAVSVLINSVSLLNDKKDSMVVGMIGGGAICFMGIFMGYLLFGNYDAVKNIEIPIFFIAKKYGSLILNLYGVVILAAIFTTAIGNGFSWVCYICENHNIKRMNSVILISILGVISYFIPFSVFVDKGYRFFGYLGLFEFIVIIYCFIKEKIKEKLDNL